MLSRRDLIAGAAVTAIAAVSASAAAVRDDLDLFVMSQMRTATIPGLALGVAEAGKVVLARGYGLADMAARRPVTTSSMFHIASITKTVTAAAMMRLVETGRLGLDDPVGRHLDFAVANPDFPEVPITVRHLLMHTSSISDATYYKVDFRTKGSDSPLRLEDFLRSYLVPGGEHYSKAGSFSASAPGSRWDYCNVAYGLLGLIASRVAGIDMRRFTEERFFAPLGMRHTCWTIADVPPAARVTPYDVTDAGRLAAVEPVGFPDWSAGMLRASIADFTRFLACCCNGGGADGVRILSSATTAEMLDMRTPAGLPQWLSGQGLGWMASPLGRVRRINHWGGDPGAFTAAYLDPVARRGVAIFANTSATPASKAAIKAIAERLLPVE